MAARLGARCCTRLLVLFVLTCSVFHISYQRSALDHVQVRGGHHNCALLFFGLPRHFKRIVLPSIKQHILDVNPTCDVFVHTYIAQSATLERNGEFNVPLHPEEVLLLTGNAVNDTFEGVSRAVDFRKYHPYHFKNWGPCCGSTDNMIKQWYSIKRVWELMDSLGQAKAKERHGSPLSDASASGSSSSSYYSQVGLFRNDVQYQTPINIFDSVAAVPGWAAYGGVNDRMFYGSYRYANIWRERFGYAEKFMRGATEYAAWRQGRNLPLTLHSERLLKHLLLEQNVPIELKDACFWKVRHHRILRSCSAGAAGNATEVRGTSAIDLDVSADGTLHGYG